MSRCLRVPAGGICARRTFVVYALRHDRSRPAPPKFTANSPPLPAGAGR